MHKRRKQEHSSKFCCLSLYPNCTCKAKYTVLHRVVYVWQLSNDSIKSQSRLVVQNDPPKRLWGQTTQYRRQWGLDPQSDGCWTYKPHQGGWLVIKDTCNPEHQKVLTEWKNWFSAMFSKVFVAFVGNYRQWGLDPQSNALCVFPCQ